MARRSLPSLARFGPEDDPTYLVCDPTLVTGRRKIHENGTVENRRELHTGAALVAGIAAFLLVPHLIPEETRDALSIFLLVPAAVAGIAALAFTAFALDLLHRLYDRSFENRASRRAPVQNAVRVRPSNEIAWEICRTASRIAATRSWTTGTVDRSGRVPHILWLAASRAVELDSLHHDASRALSHASLADVARATLHRVSEERSALDAVRGNLDGVLLAATTLDQREQAAAAAERQASARRREEEHLRRRLLGNEAYRLTTDDQVDDSAGLAAESQAVAELLNLSDELLTRHPRP